MQKQTQGEEPPRTTWFMGSTAWLDCSTHGGLSTPISQHFPNYSETSGLHRMCPLHIGRCWNGNSSGSELTKSGGLIPWLCQRWGTWEVTGLDFLGGWSSHLTHGGTWHRGPEGRCGPPFPCGSSAHTPPKPASTGGMDSGTVQSYMMNFHTMN